MPGATPFYAVVEFLDLLGAAPINDGVYNAVVEHQARLGAINVYPC